MKASTKGSLKTVIFGKTPEKSEQVCRVENLNDKRKIFATMREDGDSTEYVVCLCLTNNKKVVTTKLRHKEYAEELMEKYRMLYKEIE